ncbi:hypothetical protein ACHAO4_007585 [Trichoderma viride]
MAETGNTGQDGPVPFDIAVIGGGIIGLHVALGLIKRNIPVVIYEKASELKEIGAGLGFTETATQCMQALNPSVAGALGKVGIATTGSLRWINGKKDGFPGCHRGQFLNELVSLVPPNLIKLGKRIVSIEQKSKDEKLVLKFSDGTEALADAVVGCDGIKSRVRQIVLGEDNPASYPHYSHQSAYRALIEMDKALAALGHLPSGQLMYLGPRAHINTYPVGRGKFMNFVAFIQDKNEWPDNENLTAPASKADVVEAFSKFGPAVRAMIDLLPTSLIDGQSLTPLITHSHPSHMTASVLLEMRLMPALRITVLGHNSISKSAALTAAFKTYDNICRERGQWLVESSRYMAELFQGSAPDVGDDFDKFKQQIRERSHKVWFLDWKDMVRRAVGDYDARVRA